MVTNIRDADTYLDINFGDQSGTKTFSLATNQIAAGVDPSNYELDHLYLVESYTEECHLAVAIHHQYENQVSDQQVKHQRWTHILKLKAEWQGTITVSAVKLKITSWRYFTCWLVAAWRYKIFAASVPFHCHKKPDFVVPKKHHPTQ